MKTSYFVVARLRQRNKSDLTSLPRTRRRRKADWIEGSVVVVMRFFEV
jgi:hypothetical protein